jgi:DNA-binding LytR/AlgR family response regulator
MINCYVIDDEFHAIQILDDFIAITPGLNLIGHTTNPLIGLEYITSNKPPDITFIDINMPELSGMELAGLVNQLTKIIFTTAYDKFAVEAFEKNAFDYLLKPITIERFTKCINRYKNHYNNIAPATDDYFYVKGDSKSKLIRINTIEILYIESALNYIIIHTATEKQITYLTMGEIESYLPESSFSRIQRSFIVNHNKIKSVSADEIVLVNKTVLDIGDIYKQAFFEKINSNILKTKRLR